MRMLANAIALACAALCTACSDDGVDPITKITSPRVLAITADPSALVPDGMLHLAVMTVDADGPRSDERPVDAVRVRACAPWKFVVDPARDCVGAESVALERDETGRFVMSASELAAAFPSPPNAPIPSSDPWRAALAAGVSLRIPVIAEVDVDGQTLVAKREVEVVADPNARRNPQIVELRFDGAPSNVLQAGRRYTVTATIERTSLDPPDEPPDEPMDGAALEEVTCYLYSPSGEIADPNIAVEDLEPVELETSSTTYTAGAAGTTWLFVVATDETSGLSMLAQPLTIE
ncbi:MAG: hypothetical protein ACKV2T_06495 [Kofleriaceae bacterium]